MMVKPSLDDFLTRRSLTLFKPPACKQGPRATKERLDHKTQIYGNPEDRTVLYTTISGYNKCILYKCSFPFFGSSIVYFLSWVLVMQDWIIMGFMTHFLNLFCDGLRANAFFWGHGWMGTTLTTFSSRPGRLVRRSWDRRDDYSD